MKDRAQTYGPSPHTVSFSRKEYGDYGRTEREKMSSSYTTLSYLVRTGVDSGRPYETSLWV